MQFSVNFFNPKNSVTNSDLNIFYLKAAAATQVASCLNIHGTYMTVSFS